jgi:hypothetical protein
MRLAKAVVIFLLLGLFFATTGRADAPAMGYLGKGKSRLSFAGPVRKVNTPKSAARRTNPLHLHCPRLPRIHRPHF